MMPTNNVFIIRPVSNEFRPYIDFEIKENSQDIAWSEIGKIVRGTSSSAEYRPKRLVVRAPDALEWDYYGCAGTLGLLSSKAASCLAPYSTKCFDLLQASINDEPYFFLTVKHLFDCFDKLNSTFITFPSNQDKIMEIQKYSFKKEVIPDPLLFVIPEGLFHVFGTDSIPSVIARNGLRGFDLTKVD